MSSVAFPPSYAPSHHSGICSFEQKIDQLIEEANVPGKDRRGILTSALINITTIGKYFDRLPMLLDSPDIPDRSKVYLFLEAIRNENIETVQAYLQYLSQNKATTFFSTEQQLEALIPNVIQESDFRR